MTLVKANSALLQAVTLVKANYMNNVFLEFNKVLKTAILRPPINNSVYTFSVTDSLNCYSLILNNSSVTRQTTESQNWCLKKTKHAKFSEKRTILSCLYQGVRNVCLS